MSEKGEHENVIQHGEIDKLFFDDIKERSVELKNEISEASETLSTADKLAEDTYHSLHQYSPQKRDKESMRRGYELNHDLIEKLMSLDEYEKMRTRTERDEVQSAIATSYFMQNLINSMTEEELEKLEEQQEEVKKREEKIQSLIDNIEGLESLDDLDKTSVNLDEYKEELESLREQQEEDLEDLEESITLNSKVIRNATKGAIVDAKEETESFKDVLAGWGIGGGTKEASKLSVEDKINIAKTIKDNEKIIEMADMIGKMTRLSKSVQKRKVHKVPEYVEEIETGRDLQKALPSELAYLGHEDAKPLFLKKYAESQILQYKMKGHEKAGKGAMVVCVDTSGSMSGIKEKWAKAVALALYNVSRRQNRPYRAINFSGEGQYKVYDISTENGIIEGLKRDGKTQRKIGRHKESVDEEKSTSMVEFLEDSFGSGTDFDTPLKKGMEIIEVDEDYDKADMVFISDGIAKASQEVLDDIKEAKNKLEFQIIGVAINVSPEGLEEFSDSIFRINNFEDGGMKTAQNIFELV